jgi:hypothetical protein
LARRTMELASPSRAVCAAHSKHAGASWTRAAAGAQRSTTCRVQTGCGHPPQHPSQRVRCPQAAVTPCPALKRTHRAAPTLRSSPPAPPQTTAAP